MTYYVYKGHATGWTEAGHGRLEAGRPPTGSSRVAPATAGSAGATPPGTLQLVGTGPVCTASYTRLRIIRFNGTAPNGRSWVQANAIRSVAGSIQK